MGLAITLSIRGDLVNNGQSRFLHPSRHNRGHSPGILVKIGRFRTGKRSSRPSFPRHSLRVTSLTCADVCPLCPCGHWALRWPLGSVDVRGLGRVHKAQRPTLANSLTFFNEGIFWLPHASYRLGSKTRSSSPFCFHDQRASHVRKAKLGTHSMAMQTSKLDQVEWQHHFYLPTTDKIG